MFLFRKLNHKHDKTFVGPDFHQSLLFICLSTWVIDVSLMYNAVRCIKSWRWPG